MCYIIEVCSTEDGGYIVYSMELCCKYWKYVVFSTKFEWYNAKVHRVYNIQYGDMNNTRLRFKVNSTEVCV